MHRQRVRDVLAGAGLAVVALLSALAIVLWLATGPRGGGDATSTPTSAATTAPSRPPAARPPADLADDETWLGDLVLDAGTVVAAGSLLRDVRAVGEDVRTGPDGVVAGRLAIDATVPFDVVAEQLGGDGITVGRAGRDRATVERTLPFGARELRVVATGRVTVEQGLLVVEPTTVDVGGPPFVSDVLGAITRRLVTIEHAVEGIPQGLVLRDVTVQDDGFRARLTGTDVRLTQ